MTEFRVNNAGLREYLRGVEYVPALERVALQVQARAKSNANVETGTFRDSIHIERHRSPDRNVVRVVADSPAARAIEARDRALGRAV